MKEQDSIFGENNCLKFSSEKKESMVEINTESEIKAECMGKAGHW